LDCGAVGEKAVRELLENGWICQRYANKIDADLVKYRSYRMDWEGLNFIVLNTGRFNSLTFAALDKPKTGHDALLGYMSDGKCWKVSLYHAKHNAEIDLSKIVVKYGGGGHRGACGFTCAKLPF
jgi:nanoRNase/pAp phosphatase (c-di-AMP/oligoRNAs hydrolase)